MSSIHSLRYVLGVTSDTSVFFGANKSPSRPGQPLSSRVWICVGGLAIPLWATWPALSLQMKGVPWISPLAFAIGLSGSAACFMFATHHIPAAEANLISYAWDEGFRRGDTQLLAVMAYATPLCSTLFLIALGLESFTWKLLIGAIVIVAAGILSHATRS